MSADTPDLKRLLVGLGNAVAFRHPEWLAAADVKRVDDAEVNVLLVLSRVLTKIAKQAGVTQDEVKRIVEDAKRRQVQPVGSMFEPARPVDADVVTGRVDMHRIISQVDKSLTDPKRRGKMPEWFVDDFWPGVMRRVASGRRMTDRECEIAMYVVSVAGGEW